MAKPILVIRFALNTWKHIDERDNLVKQIAVSTGYEYHILLCPDQLIDSTQFEVHNTNNNTPTDLKDLEERLSILIEGAADIFNLKKDEEKELEKRLTELQLERFKTMHSYSSIHGK